MSSETPSVSSRPQFADLSADDAADLAARFAIALIQAVEFVRDYPLGTEDRYYDERRADVLHMPETHEALSMLTKTLSDDIK